MANVRFVVDNAADRATLTAASVATLTASNLQQEGRTVKWRTDNTTATIHATWPLPEFFNCVALIGNNLSEEALWRISAQYLGKTVLDSDWLPAVPPQTLSDMRWGHDVLGVSAFYGNSRLSLFWPDSVAADALTIEIKDPTNPNGFIEASRLVVGLWWEPECNQDWGGSWKLVQNGRRERLESGDVITEPGASYRVLSLSLPMLSVQDRNALSDMQRRIGNRPFLLSLMPAANDRMQEADYSIWGVFPLSYDERYARYQRWSTTLEIEEA